MKTDGGCANGPTLKSGCSAGRGPRFSARGPGWRHSASASRGVPAQPEERQPRHPAGPARRHHRRFRFGKIVASTRSAPRGSSAYVESLSVRAPVHWTDGQAGRGLHRRPVAHRHRTALGDHNPRSTVGTVTEIYDYLRCFCTHRRSPLLSRARDPSQTIDMMIDHVHGLPEGLESTCSPPSSAGRRGVQKS